MEDPNEEMTRAHDPGAIGPIIDRLLELQAQGVTHVFARNRFGQLELVQCIAPDDARTRYDDGNALGVEIVAQIVGPAAYRSPV